MAGPVAPSTYVSSRKLGEATISVISDGSGRSTIVKDLEVPESEWRKEVRESDPNGDITVGYNVVHVRIGQSHLLFDLGFDDPSDASPWKPPRHKRSPGVLAGLNTLGVQPGWISHVCITHAHGDHIAGATTVMDNGQRQVRYPRARFFLGKADWEGNPERNDPNSMLAQNLGPVARAGKLQLIDSETEIVPGVTMIPAPGESPGHSIIKVESQGQTFYYVGDLFHHPVEVKHTDWVSKGRDQAAMKASRDALVGDAAMEGAMIVFTHRPFPGWGKITFQAGGYGWQDG